MYSVSVDGENKTQFYNIEDAIAYAQRNKFSKNEWVEIFCEDRKKIIWSRDFFRKGRNESSY
jgi:hypothetical protein